MEFYNIALDKKTKKNKSQLTSDKLTPIKLSLQDKKENMKKYRILIPKEGKQQYIENDTNLPIVNDNPDEKHNDDLPDNDSSENGGGGGGGYYPKNDPKDKPKDDKPKDDFNKKRKDDMMDGTKIKVN
jgi:hypothetical protein